MNGAEYIENIKKTYQVVKVLSQKNSANILKLRHFTLGKELVLKHYQQPVPAYEILLSLKHENLPEIYEVIPVSDGQIVLEEYIDGVTVADVLESGRYTWQGAKKVLRGLCAAVMALHGYGIIHRDIKPENVMVTTSGQIKLIDLNVSRQMDPTKEQDTMILGTLGYAPYEQMGISQCDCRTDVFSLGVLLNVMLTGEHPSRMLAQGKAGKIVLKCTQIDPDSRYQSAEALLAAM